MGDEIGVRRDIAEHRAVSPTSRDQRSPTGTGINWPVLQRASAEATNATTGARSPGRPSRGGGRFAARGECRRSSPICLHRVVWVGGAGRGRCSGRCTGDAERSATPPKSRPLPVRTFPKLRQAFPIHLASAGTGHPLHRDLWPDHEASTGRNHTV